MFHVIEWQEVKHQLLTDEFSQHSGEKMWQNARQCEMDRRILEPFEEASYLTPQHFAVSSVVDDCP